ncbi:dolichyl-phosphate-mannose--protein mannosyltransferase [Corynebacterium sp. 319]|uniref:dolichyl-phosphate-mannose--protein mannosyltransferase n=1 Tax=unclassified Corynebacterium TaxID=2624378 RepID=UPI00351B5304
MPITKIASLTTPQAHNPRTWRLTLLTLAIFGFLTRLIGLNHPTDSHTPIFDEKHYVPQAWQIARSWTNPFLPGMEDNPGFGLVVHPPLAKQIMAVFMHVFGYNPWGWRVASALAGVAVILLIAGIARRLSGSHLVGLLAGVFALCDGILFVTARSGMLDHLQTLAVVAATYFAVRDAHQTTTRFRRVHAEGRINDHPFGPRMGFRWWRFGVAVALGCALSIKWSGLYYMAFFGVTVVIVDYLRRRRFGVSKPLVGTAVLDVPPHFCAAVIYPVVIYVLSWRSWFASESGVFRHAVESGRYERTDGWAWSFLPDTVQNFIYYHVSVLKFHSELTNSNGHHHSWESKPWSWLATTRSLMYYNPDSSQGKHTVVLLVGTPAIWWLCVPAILWALWCLVIRRQPMWLVPVVGFAAGFLPWLPQMDRQMYLFYATNLAPFVVMSLAMIMGQVWNSPRLSLRWRQIIVIGYSTVVVWNFLFFLPIYAALPLSDLEYELRLWLPSWS